MHYNLPPKLCSKNFRSRPGVHLDPTTMHGAVSATQLPGFLFYHVAINQSIFV